MPQREGWLVEICWSRQSTALGKDHCLVHRCHCYGLGPHTTSSFIFPANKTMFMCHQDLYDQAKLAILVLYRASRNWSDSESCVGRTIVVAPLPSVGKKQRGWQEDGTWYSLSNGCPCTHLTQDMTRHPGFPAVQLWLTCDQICAGSESLHIKYCAKEKREMEIIGNHVNMCDHWQATSTGLST